MAQELSIKETVLKELNLTDDVLVQWGTNKDGSRADITLADVIEKTISECEKRYNQKSCQWLYDCVGTSESFKRVLVEKFQKAMKMVYGGHS